MDYIVKNLHFILIHIPLSMLIFSFIFDLLAWTLNKREWHTAAALCLFAGTLGAVASVLTGPSMPNPAVQKHALYGQLSMALFIVLSLVRLWFIWKKNTDSGRNPAYLAAALVGVLLITYTGHLGGQMVHKEKGPGMQRPNGLPASQSGTPPEGGGRTQP